MQLQKALGIPVSYTHLDVYKRQYVNATEGAIIYGISKSRIMVLASEAGAVYKVCLLYTSRCV